MEQRSLRLGDIVDDYCPRERRITNHAIVAIVEDAIRQTRCTTCEHEHVFKQGREPARRKKPEETLFEQVMADVTGVKVVSPMPPAALPRPSLAAAALTADVPLEAPRDEGMLPPESSATSSAVATESFPAHRTLIRATLPKSADEPAPPRPIPEFTMHQRTPSGRGRAHVPARLAFGPQGHPLGPSRDGRPGPRPHAPGRNGVMDGNGGSPGNGNGAPGKNRGRRRRGGKRSR
jgi:hypothetical protein